MILICQETMQITIRTPSSNLSEEETGMQTTNRAEPVSITPTIKQQSEVKDDADTDMDDEGKEIITVGGDNESEEGNEFGTSDGDTGESGSQNNADKSTRVLIKVKLKVAAQKEQDIFYHNLIVSAEKDISNAELELLVSGDNDKDDGIAISSTDKGQIENNKLKSLSLSAGRNKIKVRFADNLKHSVKIKAYEIQ